mmetsp:Transcript_28665/g.51018  ORF Transcript_28665/g.51018 Transcript_28665/m.51018 type:complete len:276 (+) Transcript_28665:20-847(+)
MKNQRLSRAGDTSLNNPVFIAESVLEYALHSCRIALSKVQCSPLIALLAWPELPEVLVIATLKGPVFIFDMKDKAEEFKDAGLGDLLLDSIHFKLTYDFSSLWRCLNLQTEFEFNYIVDYTLLWACYQKSIGFEAGLPATMLRFCEISSPFEIPHKALYEDPKCREVLRDLRPFPQEFINFTGSCAEVVLMAWLSTYDKFPDAIKSEAIDKTHFIKREFELLPPNSAGLSPDVPLFEQISQQACPWVKSEPFAKLKEFSVDVTSVSEAVRQALKL